MLLLFTESVWLLLTICEQEENRFSIRGRSDFGFLVILVLLSFPSSTLAYSHIPLIQDLQIPLSMCWFWSNSRLNKKSKGEHNMRSVKHLKMNVRHNDRMNDNERVEGMMDDFFFFRRVKKYYTSL